MEEIKLQGPTCDTTADFKDQIEVSSFSMAGRQKLFAGQIASDLEH